MRSYLAAHPVVARPVFVFAVVLAFALSLAGCSAQPAPDTAADAASAEAMPAPSAQDASGSSTAADDETAAAAAAAVTAAPESGGGELPQPAPGAATRLDQRLRKAAEGQGMVSDEEVAAQLQPADGRWLVDEQGRRYFVTSIPKLEGYYRMEGPHKVRIKPGLLYDVVHESDDGFDIKIYAPPAIQPELQATAPPATLAPVVAPPSDRLVFESFGKGLPDSGQWRNGFVVTDFNGDGHPDIVHGPPRKGRRSPFVFLGDGAGSWQSLHGLHFPDVVLDYGDVAVADFNQDGRQDIALAMHLRGVLVFVADGDGGFETWSEGTGFASPEAHQGQADFSSRALSAVDWNGDGRMDLLVLGEGPRMVGMRGPGSRNFDQQARGVVVLLNQGDGTWKQVHQGVGGHEIFGDSLAVGDFNSDGRPDFVTSAGSINRLDLLNLSNADGTWTAQEVDALPPDSYVFAVAAADVDGDGKDDLVVGYQRSAPNGWFSGVDVLLARDGAWESHTAWRQEDQSGVYSVAAGDLDADGLTDLVAVTGWGEVWVLLGRGDGTFYREEMDVDIHQESCSGYHGLLADLDGQPGDELVLSFAGEPGSEVLFDEASPRCPSGGSLDAWKVFPKSSP